MISNIIGTVTFKSVLFDSLWISSKNKFKSINKSWFFFIGNIRPNKDEQSLLDIFGDSFGSFWDCVSCQLTGEDQLDSWLNFSGGEGSSLVESYEFWSFSGDSVEGVVDEWVHDVHGFFGDSDIWVYLLEDFVDVDGEGLDSSSSGFLVCGSLGFSWFFAHCLFNEFVLQMWVLFSIWIKLKLTVYTLIFDWLKKIL